MCTIYKNINEYNTYKILVHNQYFIYSIYDIYIYIYNSILIKAAAIGQSEEIFCPIQ